MAKGLVDKKRRVHFEPDNVGIVDEFPSVISRLISLINNQSRRRATL